MKCTTIALGFALSLIASLALAQVDQATGTVTNDATQARLRMSNCLFDGPQVDVLIDGEIAMNGGVPQIQQGMGVSGYLYLAPGSYSVALVPTGMGVDEALLGPVDVELEAGHRYTVVMMGQIDEPSHQALVIDETAAYQAVGATPNDHASITVNNIRGVSGIEVSLADVVRVENAAYGSFGAAVWPVGNHERLNVKHHDPPAGANPVLTRDPAPTNLPGMDYIDCFGGTYPGLMSLTFDIGANSTPTSGLSVIDFLRAQGEAGLKAEGSTLKYDTFLAALATTGLDELLTTGGPHLVFAPTDQAFAALPKDQFDALMADPELLADIVRSHIVEGYYPPGSLGRGQFQRTVTNLLGETLVLSGGLSTIGINNAAVGSAGAVITAANGSLVFFVINRLVLPPSMSR